MVKVTVNKKTIITDAESDTGKISNMENQKSIDDIHIDNIKNVEESMQVKHIIIDKSQYGENFKNITKYLGKKPAAALKHNAYGIGMLSVAQALDAVECETYFVNFLDEAIALRENLQNVKSIITLEYTNLKDLDTYLKYNLILSIASMEELDYLLPFLTREHQINLYFDTGLCGKGFLWTEAADVFHKTQHLNVRLVISHLSSAWKQNMYTNQKQLERFQEIKRVFDKRNEIPLYSLSNTDGTRLGPEYTLDLVRHGRGMHGLSYYGNQFHIKPAFRLVGKIHQVKKAPTGSKSGYGALVDVPEGTNIGIVDVGTFYINKINFKFTNQIKWIDKASGKEHYFNVLTLALGYSIVDLQHYNPGYLDEVEFVFVSRFDNP